jgi:superfamily II DNA/RNA helicase
LKALVIDEADRILEIGFEEEMKRIITILPNGAPACFPSFGISSSSSQQAVDALLRNADHQSS